jgi:hypothetical protein
MGHLGAAFKAAPRHQDHGVGDRRLRGQHLIDKVPDTTGSWASRRLRRLSRGRLHVTGHSPVPRPAARQRKGLELGRILPGVFVDTEKGPAPGAAPVRFNKGWRWACRRAGYTGTLLRDLRRSRVPGEGEVRNAGKCGHEDQRLSNRGDFQAVRHLQRSGSEVARDRSTQFGHNSDGESCRAHAVT